MATDGKPTSSDATPEHADRNAADVPPVEGDDRSAPERTAGDEATEPRRNPELLQQVADTTSGIWNDLKDAAS
jgi:hypothetical protein